MLSFRIGFIRFTISAAVAVLTVLDYLAVGVSSLCRGIYRLVAGSSLDRSSTGTTRKRVVIIGGSFAGLRVQRELSSTFDVTVVDQKEYFEYTPGVLRLYTQPKLLSSMTTALPTKRSSVVVGTVTDLSDNEVILEDGRRLPYDYAVIACGAGYPCSGVRPTKAEQTLAQRQATWNNAANALASAESVVIAGGGIVGVELAGEIITAHPNKKVTLLTSGDKICSALAPKVGLACRRWLERKGVTIRFNSPVETVDQTTGSITLRGGEEITASIAYDCRGNGPSNARNFFAEGKNRGDNNTMASAALDEKGGLTAETTLLVPGSNGRVYAAGDAMYLPSFRDPKLGHTAELNADVVAENIIAHHSSSSSTSSLSSPQSDGRLHTYPFGAVGAPIPPRVYCVSLGEANGILIFNDLVIEGLLAALVKPVLEWTKVAAAAERPIGIAFWKFGDACANWLSRNVMPLRRTIEKS